MKSFYHSLLIAVVLFSGISCENEDISPPVKEHSSSEKMSPRTLEQKELALFIAELPMKKDQYHEVFDAVTTASEDGLEEAYYFTEILASKPITNKIVNSYKSKSKYKRVGELMKEFYLQDSKYKKLTNNKKKTVSTLNLEKIANSNLQIYWPYSENWDGRTAPAITFAPENENQEWNYAYKKTERGIDTIIVNEEYMMNNPVWIINTSEEQYENLPAFSKGQNSNYNTLYINKEKDKVTSSKKNAPIPVYSVFLGKFMSSHQYDKIWSGGSEFIIQLGNIEHFKIESADNLSSLDPHIARIKVPLSRKDIRKRRWKELNGLLLADWHPNSSDAGFMIYEEDQGRDEFWEIKVPIKIGGNKEVSIPIKIPYKSHDDMIYKTVISRNFILSTNNLQGSTWVEHRAGDVKWTLPFKVGYTIIQ